MLAWHGTMLTAQLWYSAWKDSATTKMPHWYPEDQIPDGPRASEPDPNAKEEVRRLTATAMYMGDADIAMRKLKAALGRWPACDAEIYFVMGQLIRERKTPETAQEWREPLEYFKKCLALIEAGGRFVRGEHSNRVQHVKMIIRVCRRNAGLPLED